jgi:hypothetical protein
MIEWRRTAGGVEIAEFGDMTAVRFGQYIHVMRGGVMIDSFECERDPKYWFEQKYYRPEYTVTKYPDGGEVYVSEDEQRVAMVSSNRGRWWTEKGNGQGDSHGDEKSAIKQAIDYVNKETA